jgi:histone H3/H4
MFPDRTDRAVRIVGVEAASIDQFGIGLSEPVARALPDAVEAVLRSVGGADALMAEARRLAEVESRVTVTLEQVLGG